MEKKRVIKSMENISAEVMEMVKKKYPDGWANHVIRVNKGNNEFFHMNDFVRIVDFESDRKRS